MAGRERLLFLDRQVVQRVLAFAANLQHVSESARRDQPGGCAFALDQRVREQRRRMHHAMKRRVVQRKLIEDLAYAGQHRVGRIGVSGEHLSIELTAVALIVDRHVGKRAANVHT